jgi:prevent-host-death family protein
MWVMSTINIHAAKTQFSRLVEAAAQGEEIVIARAGVPLARLVPLEPVVKRRQLGMLAGRMTVPTDFDAPLHDDELDRFEGV